jgi:hypothetical protein
MLLWIPWSCVLTGGIATKLLPSPAENTLRIFNKTYWISFGRRRSVDVKLPFPTPWWGGYLMCWWLAQGPTIILYIVIMTVIKNKKRGRLTRPVMKDIVSNVINRYVYLTGKTWENKMSFLISKYFWILHIIHRSIVHVYLIFSMSLLFLFCHIFTSSHSDRLYLTLALQIETCSKIFILYNGPTIFLQRDTWCTKETILKLI